MPRIITIIPLMLFVFVAYGGALLAAEGAGPVRPYAADFIVLDNNPGPVSGNYLYSPAIITLPDRRLVASYYCTLASSPKYGQNFYTSDDGGLTWDYRWTEPGAQQGRFFLSGDDIYYISPGTLLPIMRSSTRGETWTEVSYLDPNNSGMGWNQTAANVWYANGRVYVSMDVTKKDRSEIGGAWNVVWRAPVIWSAPVGTGVDLLDHANWVRSDNGDLDNRLYFGDYVTEALDESPDIGLFGIPFYVQSFPVTTRKDTMAPIGWVESHTVQVMDPSHPWYDPTGKTFYVFMRAQSGRTNLAGVCKAVESEDGSSIDMSLVESETGSSLIYIPMPGGHQRFHILYDEESQLYWLLNTQTTDSMRRYEKLEPKRYLIAFEERQRMVLHYSKDLIHWQFAALVDAEPSINGSRHYACMDFDGDDIVVLSRSGDSQAVSAHNGNLISFHRVKNFRSLVY